MILQGHLSPDLLPDFRLWSLKTTGCWHFLSQTYHPDQRKEHLSYYRGWAHWMCHHFQHLLQDILQVRLPVHHPLFHWVSGSLSHMPVRPWRGSFHLRPADPVSLPLHLHSIMSQASQHNTLRDIICTFWSCLPQWNWNLHQTRRLASCRWLEYHLFQEQWKHLRNLSHLPERQAHLRRVHKKYSRSRECSWPVPILPSSRR